MANHTKLGHDCLSNTASPRYTEYFYLGEFVNSWEIFVIIKQKFHFVLFSWVAAKSNFVHFTGMDIKLFKLC